jgi:hypothetical protein
LFQTLNTTGTPLTSIETFKPLVVDYSRNQKQVNFAQTKIGIAFEKIESLFRGITDSNQKLKLTSSLLTPFALAFNGQKLPNQFSSQKRLLSLFSGEIQNQNRQLEMVEFLGDFSDFFSFFWLNGFKEKNLISFEFNEGQKNTLKLHLDFLKQCNHQMSLAPLGLEYHLLRKDSISPKERGEKLVLFLDRIVAFYSIWRTSYTNRGLDDVYRSFFMNRKDQKGQTWIGQNLNDFHKNFVLHLKEKLKQKNIDSFENWFERSNESFNYSIRVICRYAMFRVFHNSIPDPVNKGLILPGRNGVYDFFKWDNWISEAFKEIEHVAPLNGKDSEWDQDFYSPPQAPPVQLLGNLVLLPKEINISASNRGWKQKILYYKFLGQTDPTKFEELKSHAIAEGLDLKEDILEILSKTPFSGFMQPIVQVEDWSTKKVHERQKRLVKMFWNSIAPILGFEKTSI